MTDELSIDDLANHSGLSVRTLHYYMQEGLLPGPDKRGKYASYSQEHLDRLDLILILKEMHLPLKDIRALMDVLTPLEIQHYRDDQEDLLARIKAARPEEGSPAQTDEEGSALDYIKGLEEAHGMIREIKNYQSFYAYQDSFEFHRRSRDDQSRAEPPSAPPLEERWRRMVLAEGIELHTRETRDKETLYKITRLIFFVYSVFDR